MKEFYQKKIDEIYSELGATEQGHPSDAAQRVLEEKGPNVLKEGKRKSTLH